jgi:hypothetical protein
MSVVAIVTGSRHWTDTVALTEILDELAPAMVIQGGAEGADRQSREWCDRTGVPCIEVPALWTAHGKAAGPKRNTLMLRVAKTLAAARDMVVEVVACPLEDSVGTVHMIDLAEAENIFVYRVLPY